MPVTKEGPYRMNELDQDAHDARHSADADGSPLWFGDHDRPIQTFHPAASTMMPTQEIPAGSLGPVHPQGQAEHTQPARSRRLVELTAVALLAALLASGGTYAATRVVGSTDAQNPSTAQTSSDPGRGTSSSTVPQSSAAAPDWTRTAAAVGPSVVSITATTSSGEDQGSGVILDKAGNVLTNNHVVSGATAVTVSLSNGFTYKAKVRGTDSTTDLAVVRLTSPPANLSPIAIGDSSALAVGQPVMAIGNPLGLSGTVTTGIVSALNRPVKTSSADTQQDPTNPFGQPQTSEQVVTNAIQTSAAINPGNSGGALVDGAGQLIGINSSIATLPSDSSSQSGSIGIGFAIPVNEASAIAKQLIDTGTAQHAYLGVSTEDGTATDGVAQRDGARISSVVSGTPAAEAGIKAGDLVIAVDGVSVDSADSLIANIRERTAGQTVQITVLRGGKTLDLKTKLVTKPTSSN